jgi:DNA-binding transcriptional LysR family regulator
MQIDVRQLRYFVAVAEELNFTRAAKRLNVVQQSLSSAVARLESSLGFKLFERSSRAVTLTERGSQLLPYAREVLVAVERAQTAARDLATGSAGSLRVGLGATAAVELTPAVLRAFAARHPRVSLLTEHYGFEDPTGGLRDNATDVAIVRPPFAAPGLELIVVGSERRYAAVAGEHRLAHRATVTFDDVVDEPWIEIVGSDPVWCDFWRVTDRRATPPRFGAHGRTLDDLLEAARAGRAIGLVPASVANSQKWPGLAFIEVTDLPPSDIAVAWRANGRSELVDEFIAMATELGHWIVSTATRSGRP